MTEHDVPPSSSSSSSSSSQETGQKRKRADDDTGEQFKTPKKSKFDENDIDWLIGDLLKEEAQLVLTRLLRLGAAVEQEMRKHIEIVRHARAQLTPDQVSQQVMALQQLRVLQQLSTSPVRGGAGGDGLGAGFDFSAFSPVHPGGLDLHGQQHQQSPRTPATPALSNARLRSIKNRVRDSFKKSSRANRHVVDLEPIEAEVNTAKELALKGSMRQALQILEAVTDEFIDRGSQLNESSIDNYNDVLATLGNHWVDVLLTEPNDLTDDERDVWYEKIRAWDTSAHEEEGVLAAARWAARLGWVDPALVAILQGTTAAASDDDAMSVASTSSTTTFKEPPSLTIARLNILERDKRFEEAMRLAKAVGEHNHAAKFLMKMNRTEDAIEMGLLLIDPEQVFALATVARPINATAAFRLALHSVSLDASWGGSGGSTAKRAAWLCDLAISENWLSELVEQLSALVVSKSVLFEMAKLLNEKRQAAAALALVKALLPEFSLERLRSIYATALERIGNRPLSDDELPKTRLEAYHSLPHTRVPKDACMWLWSTARVAKYSEPRDEAFANATHDAVEAALAVVEHVDYLKLMLNAIVQHADSLANVQPPPPVVEGIIAECFAQVQRVGSHLVSLVCSQQEVDRTFREENLKAEFQAQLEAEAAEREGLVPVPFVPRVAEHHVYNYDQTKMEICQMILTAALKAKSRYLPKDPLPGAAVATATATDNGAAAAVAQATSDSGLPDDEREAKLKEADRVIEVVTDIVIGKILNPDDLVLLARDMSNKQEYRLALRICQKAVSHVRALDDKQIERNSWLSELEQLQRDVEALVQAKLKPPAEQVEQLRALQLRKKLLHLLPAYARKSTREYSSSLLSIANAMLTAAIESHQSRIIAPAKRMTRDELTAVVDACFEFVHSPEAQRALAQLAAQRQEHRLVIDIALRALGRIDQQLLPKLRRALVLQTEANLLQREQAVLLQRYKKESLEEAQKARLEALLLEIAALPEQLHYELPSVTAYQTLAYSLMSLRLSSAISWLRGIERELATPSLERTTEQEAQLHTELASARAAVESVFHHSLAALELPTSLTQLMAQLGSDFASLAVQAGFKAHRVLAELERERERRLLPTIELEELESERDELFAQAQHRQMLPAEKLNRIRELSLQKALWQLEPLDTRSDAQAIGKLLRDVARDMTHLLLTRERSQCLVIQRCDLTLAVVPPADDVVALAAYQQAQTDRTAALAEIASLHELLRRVTEHNLEFLEGPASLRQLAEQFVSPPHDNYAHDELHLRLNLQVTARAFEQLTKINDLRISRLPLFEERDNLVNEQDELAQYRKTLTPEKQKRLVELQRQSRLWANEVSFRQLAADQIDTTRSETAQALLNKLASRYMSLDAVRQALEAEIWTNSNAIVHPSSSSSSASSNNGMEVAGAPATDAAIQSTIAADLARAKENLAALLPRMAVVESLLNEALRLTLAHVRHPAHLLALGKAIAGTKLEAVSLIGNRVFEIVAELATEAAVREPVRDEYEQLEAQRVELASVSKQLKDDEATRLAELKHQIFLYDHDFEYTNSDWKLHTEWNKGTCHLVLSSILDAKLATKRLIKQFEAQLEKQQQQQGAGASAMDVDGAARSSSSGSSSSSGDLVKKSPLHEAAEQRLLALDAQLRSRLSECLPFLEDPAHFAAVVTLFSRHLEYDLTIDIAKYTHSKLLALETLRQQMADLEKKRYLLRLEKFTVEQNRGQFAPEYAKELADTEAKLDSLPEVRYGLDRKRLERIGDEDPTAAPPDYSTCYPFSLLDAPMLENAQAMFSAAYAKIAAYQEQVALDLSLGNPRAPEQVAAERAPLDAMVGEIVTLYRTTEQLGLSSLGHLVQLAISHSHHDAILALSEHYLARTLTLRQKQQELEPLQRELRTINNEQQLLRQQRKELTPEQLARQRDLQFLFAMRKALPDHHERDIKTLDQQAFNIYSKLLTEVFRAKAERDEQLDALVRAPRLARGRSMGASELEAEQESARAVTERELRLLVDLAIRYILEVTNLNQLVVRLNNEKVYDSMFLVAYEAQSSLKQKLSLQIVFETLRKEADVLATKLAPGAQPGPELLKLREEIELIRPQLSYSATQLRNWILQNANILIDAARIQERADIVEEQAILVFKMTMDIKKFEEVQTLVGAARWPTVRTDLLTYVIEYDTSLPGSPITAKDQILLLLKEGYVNRYLSRSLSQQQQFTHLYSLSR